jgi:hypothetical protein
MSKMFTFTLALHVTAGIIGLSAFWAPVVAKKGGTFHVKAGRIFYRMTCAIAITGLVMAALMLIDPLAIRLQGRTVTPERAARIATEVRLTVPFLLFLVLITFGPVYHGVRVLETRQHPERLRTPFHTLVNVTSIAAAAAMIGLGVWFRQPVFAALSPVGFLAGFGHLGYARQPPPSRMAWWYEHMGSMLGGGIAFHTAFFVLGAARLLPIHLTGPAEVIPWVLPSIIGIPATSIWVRYYRRKFREGRPTLEPARA